MQQLGHCAARQHSCCCWGGAGAAAAETTSEHRPLLQEGKKSLYQRVLTTPGCELVAEAGQTSGVLQPAFSSFYVYEQVNAKGAGWVKVGPDSYGQSIGWLPQSCTVDWKMQLTLAFTNPANRDRLLFFQGARSAQSDSGGGGSGRQGCTAARCVEEAGQCWRGAGARTRVLCRSAATVLSVTHPQW